MLIDNTEDTIIIDDSYTELRSDQVSQISFWGFRKAQSSNLYTLLTRDIDTILIKLVQYFDNERLPCSLSQSCQEHLTKIHSSINEFEKIKEIAQQYKNRQIDIPEYRVFLSFIEQNIPRQLKDHQVRAAFHLSLVGNGANFSVPGSGKTATILIIYEKLRLEGKVNVLFVIGPPACFGPWRTEFKLTLDRDPEYKILAGGDQSIRKSEYYNTISKKAELYLTTYQTLLNDQEELILFLSKHGMRTFLVVDEAHYIKQIGGSWATTALRIAKYATYRCVLTGTPLPRSYIDVFNLFDFLWPNNNVINSNTKIEIQMLEKNDNLEEAKGLLKEAIDPLFYRVSKGELNLLPPLFHTPYILEMNQYEKMLYKAIANKIRDYSKEDYMSNIDLIRLLKRGRITRLRQCVSYPKLLFTALENYDEPLIDAKSELKDIILNYDELEIPKKLEYLTQFVEGLQRKKQKVVIWAHFIKTLELIKNHLSKQGFYCELIYGQTPIDQTNIDEEEHREKGREMIRNEFIDPNSGLDILIANPAACAESISLHTTCYHAIYYDLSYNCAQYLQSLDRIHRVGGSETNQANYYFLQYKNTIDQDIKENLEKKAKKMYEAIGDDYGIYSLDMFEEDEQTEAYERLFGSRS